MPQDPFNAIKALQAAQKSICSMRALQAAQKTRCSATRRYKQPRTILPLCAPPPGLPPLLSTLRFGPDDDMTRTPLVV